MIYELHIREDKARGYRWYLYAPGSAMSVAEGMDDPYSYDYCAKGHHGGGHDLTKPEPDVDLWVNCPDYKEEPGKYYRGIKND